MTVKQLSKYMGKLISVTWLDSGAAYFRTDDTPSKLGLSKRLTSGIVIYVGPSDKYPDVDILVIASEQPVEESDGFSSYDANSLWVDSILDVGVPKKK